jgi:hypothetical protein
LISVDFSCAIESTILIHGRLYLSNTALLFYSNLFGIEKKLKIPYSRVKSFSQAKTALLIPNAIQIITSMVYLLLYISVLLYVLNGSCALCFGCADERTYYFRSFLERDRCVQLLSGYMPASPAADAGAEASESETDDAAAAVKKTVFQKVIGVPMVAVSAVGKAGGAVGRLIVGGGKNKKKADNEVEEGAAGDVKESAEMHSGESSAELKATFR